MKRHIMTETLHLILFFCVLLVHLWGNPIQAARDVKNYVKTHTFRLGKDLGKPLSLSLLPENGELTDEDAYDLYNVAILKLEDRQLNFGELDDLARSSLESFDTERAETLIQEQSDIIDHINKASCCGSCEWPYLDSDSIKAEMEGGRALTHLVAIKTHLEISKGDFEAAGKTLCISFAMARHSGQSSALLRGIVGIGIAGFALRQIETFIQHPGAPSLIEPLKRLPQPFFELEEQILHEYGDDPCDPDTIRVQSLNLRFQRHLAALICIEALRHYATINDGVFPKTLAALKGLSVPHDPAIRQPFNYRVSEEKAILQGPIPTHGRPRDRVHYEIIIKKL